MHPGDRLPDRPVTIQTGEQRTLEDLRDGRPMVLFFYPHDETPTCTKEACAFRDAYADFVEAGAAVVGVSSDSVASHRSFADRHHLPYTLVADTGGRLRRTLNVPRRFGFFEGRVTYVIDREGIVQHVFEAAFAAQEHVDEALAVVRRLVDDA